MFVVDTNVLLFAADAAAIEHQTCRTLVHEACASPGAWFLTWGVIYEFLRVSTHPKVFRRPMTGPQAWQFVAAMLESPGLEVLAPGDRHAEVAAGVIAEIPSLAGNIMHDAATAILMREHGVRRIYTRDTDFHRFPFLEPVDPLR